MGVTIYVDWISQPSRAVVAVCRLGGIPYNVVELRVFKGEHLTEEYERINPEKKVPALVDGKFSLFESHAIMRYLCNSNTVPENLYPRKDLRRRALIDAYLDWHHSNTRYACIRVLWGTRAPDVFPEKINLPEMLKVLARCFAMFEKFWLKDGAKYIGGGDAISIADVSAYCELVQLQLIDYDFTPYKTVQAWFARVKAHPEVEGVHEQFNKIVAAKKPKI